MQKILMTSFVALAFLLSCTDEYEQATITFYPTLEAASIEPAAGEQGTPYRVDLITSRILAQESQVNIRIEGNGAGYGNSYLTNPPPLQPGVITLTIPANESTASFTFTPLNDGVVEVNDYTYRFTIAETSNSIRSIGQDVFTFRVTEPPLFAADFNTCSGSPAGFVERIVPGAMAAATWACTDFGYPNETTKAAEANAFGKGAGISNAYLILQEPLDGADFNELFISMRVYSRFSGAGQIRLKYSTNYSGTGNPEAEGVIWTEVPGSTALLPGAGSRVWADVEGNISGIVDEQVYIAIQFSGGTTSSSSNWRIDDLNIKAK